MYPEYYEEFHYVVEEREIVEREVPPFSERLKDQNLWIGCDWYYYNAGINDGSLGIKRSTNPFYLLGYEKAQEKYR
jgi:hypothetical protein